MPMGNRTGPWGVGHPMGWREGPCRGPFGGVGRHGWRNRYHATGLPGWMRGGLPGRDVAPEVSAVPSEREHLRRHADMLESELRWVRARLAELEHEPTTAA